MTVIDKIEAFKYVMSEMDRIQLDIETRVFLAQRFTRGNTLEEYIMWDVCIAFGTIENHHCIDRNLVHSYMYYYCIVSIFYGSRMTRIKTIFGELEYTKNKAHVKRRDEFLMQLKYMEVI